MANVTLNIDKSVFNAKLFPLLFDYSHRFEFYKGSAGSGKSYFATQKILLRCLKEPNFKAIVCRRYATTIRNTCFALFKDLIKQWQLTPYCKIRETDFTITFCNGSEIIFIGLDTETKLLSLTNISTIFIEEVYEVPQSIFEQLNLRMRGKQPNQQIIACFNPVSKSSWLYDFCVVNPPKDLYFSETTYLDNKFLSAEYVATLEDLKTRNPAKARVYCFGEWGTDVEGLVLTNWEKQSLNANELAQQFEHRVGVDVGWSDPTAIVDSFYDAGTGTIYIVNEWYERGQTLDQIFQAICDMNLQKSKMYCDSASPREIDFLKSHNVPAYPCKKGAGSVEARISFLQNQHIIVDPKCKNVITELENFAYEKDKKTEQYVDDKYTHEWSHSIDALGYAYSDIYTKRGLTTISKASLGL